MNIEHSPLRIALYTDSDVFAGTERHILDLARALSDLGQTITIAAPPSDNPNSLAQRVKTLRVDFLPIPKQGHIDKFAIQTFAALLQQNKLDIIHAHNGRTHIAAARAIQRAKRGACIVTQHFLAPARTTRRGIKAFIANRLHKHADKFTAHTIAISHAVRDAALQRRDTAPEKITTVHNGIYPPNLAATSASPSETQTPKPETIFSAARLEPEKDLNLLIAAMTIVYKQHPAARCLIAGEGQLRQTLQNQINTLNLHNTVTLLGFRNDIPQLLNDCDIFILPSRAEPFGLVVVEAMALAKPIITANTAGPAEIIDPASGISVAPSAENFAHAILKLLDNPTLAQTLAQAARQRYESHFTAPRMAAKILNIYQSSPN